MPRLREVLDPKAVKKKGKPVVVALEDITTNARLRPEAFATRDWYIHYLDSDGFDMLEIGVPLSKAAHVTSTSDLTEFFSDNEGKIIETPQVLDGASVRGVFQYATEQGLIKVENQNMNKIIIKRVK